MENIKIKKFPRSINNKQCLGPCYKPETKFIHPVYLQNVKNDFLPVDKPICPTVAYEKKDELTNIKRVLTYDTCKIPTHDKDVSTPESLLFFQSGFTKDIFLSLYYNINSFESALEWINENENIPIETRERIINAALNLYGDNLEYLDDVFVNFYISYIKDKFMNIIYKNINENIGSKDNEILIVKSTNNNLKINDLKIERINYISEKFFNYTDTKKFLIKYIKAKNILFEDYNDVLYVIYAEHLQYIKNIISNILFKN
jgi:hypothetical protein